MGKSSQQSTSNVMIPILITETDAIFLVWQRLAGHVQEVPQFVYRFVGTVVSYQEENHVTMALSPIWRPIQPRDVLMIVQGLMIDGLALLMGHSHLLQLVSQYVGMDMQSVMNSVMTEMFQILISAILTAQETLMGGHVQEETIAILQIAKRFVETEEDWDLRPVMTVLFLGLLLK